VQIADGTGSASKTLYGKKPGHYSSDLQRLVADGLIEMRYFEGERGRGGEVMRFRFVHPRNNAQKRQSGLDQVIVPKIAALSQVPEILSQAESPMEQGNRHLATIMYTDMVGYTALGQRNESLSLALIHENNKLLRPIFERHGGKIVKTMGDAFLVQFRDALSGVRCGYDVQRALRELNVVLPLEKQFNLRIGLHLGDVVESRGDIFGDAVNIASRVESFAESGGICLTRQVYDQVRNKINLTFTSLGERALKNVELPIELYKINLAGYGDRLESKEQATESNRIAVLPFANMSADPNDSYFADGMTEEVISTLSKIPALTVISRTSSMKYKNANKSTTEIARELKVGKILEGSVRKSANRLRITTQLIDSINDINIWTESYDKELEDVFAIQKDVAENVAKSLKIRMVMTPERETEDIIAYSEFLRARELLHETEEDKTRSALLLFESAIERDPNFARAYVGIALCYRSLGEYAHMSFIQSIENAKAALEKAFTINDQLADAYAVLAYIEGMEDNMRAEEVAARKAIELNPNLSEAYSSLAAFKLSTGDLEGSIKLREKALQLDPLDSWNLTNLGQEYFWSGRESDALKIWKTSVKLAPYMTWDLMMDYYINKGDYEKAEETISQLQKIEPNNPENSFWVAYLAALKGDPEKASKVIELLEGSSEEGSVTINGIGLIYYALGDLDRFFQQMKKSKEAHTLSVSILRYSPLVAKARGDPRMGELLEDYSRL